MGKLTYKERIEQAKDEVRNAGYVEHSYYDRENKLIGTLYIKKKMDYGFHIYFIHEPNPKTVAGVLGALTEMYYDLRNRVYWVKRNLKEVKFSVRNVDSIFPQRNEEMDEVFRKLSTPNNIGLYESAFQYLGAMGMERTNLVGRFFHRLITEHSYFELLHKAGIEVTSSLHIENKQGRSPREILGLTKTQWKMVSKYGVEISTFRHRQYNNEADKVAINYLAYLKRLENDYGLNKIQDFVYNEFDYIYNGYTWRSALSIANEYNLPVKRFIEYIYFECDVSQGLDSRNAIQEYEDYIRMATEMGYERFDRYPRFLRTYHDITARNYRVSLHEVNKLEWKESYEKNLQYKTSLGDYAIFPPEKPEDLVKEGNVLGHCVGSYVKKVQKGISTILFLRQKEDVEHPLVTVEIRDGKITQARGKLNNPPTSEQKEVLKRFAERFSLKYSRNFN